MAFLRKDNSCSLRLVGDGKGNQMKNKKWTAWYILQQSCICMVLEPMGQINTASAAGEGTYSESGFGTVIHLLLRRRRNRRRDHDTDTGAELRRKDLR